jgi:hypothetical protein
VEPVDGHRVDFDRVCAGFPGVVQGLDRPIARGLQGDHPLLEARIGAVDPPGFNGRVEAAQALFGIGGDPDKSGVDKQVQ